MLDIMRIMKIKRDYEKWLELKEMLEIKTRNGNKKGIIKVEFTEECRTYKWL